MGGEGAPCGACKFLRRKCVKGCVFARYFCSDEMGAPHFGAIHKVFGASNFSKLLMYLPVQQRHDAVVSVLYDAESRLQDPVYGCVSHIYALQQKVANLKGKLSVGYAQIAACSSSNGVSRSSEFGYGNQSEMSSLISNCNNNNPYDIPYVNPWGDLQHIPSDNIGMNNYNGKAREDEGSGSGFSEFIQCDNRMSTIHALSTAQEMDVVQDGEGLFEQRHPINNNGQDGDLQDLILAVLRRNRSTISRVLRMICALSANFA